MNPWKDFWELNKKKAITLSSIIFVPYTLICCVNFTVKNLIFSVVFATAITTLFIIIECVKGYNNFNIIYKLVNPETKYSLRPIFDNEPIIEFMYKNDRFTFARPTIKGTISGLPVACWYHTASRSTWAYLTISFSPLQKEGSRFIKGKSIQFTRRFDAFPKPDMKEKILAVVEEAKVEGLTSGVNRALPRPGSAVYAE